MQTPIVFIIFNRPDTTEQVFQAIRQAKPSKLLVIADGHRSNIAGEKEKCNAVRSIIDRVDWNCEVLKNYSENNMGCRARIASGLNWVFAIVEEAIILEDDCLPHPSFFQFCEDLLCYYRNDERIMVISGGNFQFGRKQTENSYYFSRYESIWGWATWRRAWQHYDVDMKLWPKVRDSNFLENIFSDPHVVNHWKQSFEIAYQGNTAWDYPWTLARWLQNGLAITPNVNLVANLGCHPDKTGFLFANLLGNLPTKAIDFPLKHPKIMTCNTLGDKFIQQCIYDLYWQPNKLHEIKKEISEFWLSLSQDDLQDDYLRDNIKKIIASGMRNESMNNEEQNFLTQISDKISIGLDRPEKIKYLLAAMLYCSAHQLPTGWYKNAAIPKWFFNDYLKYLFDYPRFFQEIGEADKYYQYINDFVSYIHNRVFSNQDSPIWQNIAWYFTQNINLINIYFNEANLKDIYTKRADIMEFALKNRGSKIDYVFPARPVNRNKIRLGIINSHFNPQTETYSTIPVFDYLDKNQFEVILYGINLTNHPLEQYCQSRVDRLVKLTGDLQAQVQTIRADDLDILLIGTNVTAVTNTVTLLALHRLARIQVTSTSSCVTTGMRNVDYYISGNLTEREIGAQEHYHEQLITLNRPAHCFNYYAIGSDIATIKPDRKSWGATDGSVIFISGANFYKIIPELKETWAKILASVPNSMLVLYPFNPNWQNNYPEAIPFINSLKANLAKYGIAENRLIIIKPLPSRTDIKECLKIADIYLDSYPFAGVNSTVDPLEIGLPPVILEGNYFRSRMASALLRSLSIPDLITNNEESYIKLAVSLGNNPQMRQYYRQQIQQKMQQNPPFLDSRSYSAQMGVLFQELFQKWQNNSQSSTTNYQTVANILPPPSNLTVNSQEFLNRLIGCVNLYYIDPLEESIVTELRQLRKQFADFWINVPSSQLENVYQGYLAKAYQALMGSDFRNESLTESEETFRQQLSAEVAKGIEQSQAINYFLAVMPYYPTGKMRVQNARTRLPHWLIKDYEQFFEPVGV